nr:hypothetical protein [uncultured Lichenicoccus sp.]
MPYPSRPAARAVLLAIASLCLAGSVRGAAQTAGSSAAASSGAGAMVITTDSDAYCRTLSKAIDAHGALPREVSDLEQQGEGLCGAGKIRSGIVRLRRALLVLRKEAPRDETGAP